MQNIFRRHNLKVEFPSYGAKDDHLWIRLTEDDHNIEDVLAKLEPSLNHIRDNILKDHSKNIKSR